MKKQETRPVIRFEIMEQSTKLSATTIDSIPVEGLAAGE
jgi:hypothetical protein